MPLKEGNIRKDEDRILRDHVHPLGVLFRQKEKTPARLSWALRLSLQVEAVFLLVLVSIFLPRRELAMISLALAALIVGSWVATVVVLALGSIRGKLYTQTHRRQMIFWSWWPVWMCCMVCLSAFLAGLLCYYLWRTYFRTYSHIAGLQTYHSVDPSVVPGLQIQDAGLAEFEEGVDVDRARGGCMMHGGHTYCVAPVLMGGSVLDNLGDAPRFGTYDYFAVGVDCCNCPNRDFRCGEWRNPMARGGIRSKDWEARPFYKLAVDTWSATYEKKVGHPLFFDWMEDPVYHWQALNTRAMHLALFYALMPWAVAFLLTILLGVLLESLVKSNTASPSDTPGPPRGFERLWEIFMPQMRQYYLDEQRQQLGLPDHPQYGAVTAPDAAKIARSSSPRPGVKWML